MIIDSDEEDDDVNDIMDDMGQEFDVTPAVQQDRLNQALNGIDDHVPNLVIARDLSDSDELADELGNVDEMDGGEEPSPS